MAGTIKGIIVEIGGDTSALQKALSKVNSATSSLSKELRGINSLLKLDPSNTELLSQKQEVLAESIDKTTEKLEELKKIQQEADEKMKNGGEVSQENYRNLQREIISTENKLKDLQVQASKWTTAGKSIEEFGNKITNISSKLDNLGSTLTTTLTLPVLAIGTAAVTTGNDFEAQMSRVQAIAGATKGELEQLTEQAMELGAETSFSASEVAAGMENLASAGFTTNEIMEAMPGLLDLAASSGAELATSSEIAASAIRGFGLEASQAGHVADVYAEAAARTNAQTEDMGEAMKYVAPVAKTVGLSLEETAAAIGIMSDAGIKGSQAGTTLRSGLTRIIKPTKMVKDAMEELDVEFYNSDGTMKSLAEIIETLKEHTEGLTDETKNQALAQIFGTEALSGMLALVNRGSDELEDMTKSFEECDGAAEDMADTMLDNTKGAFESLSGSLETAGITIQRALAPTIRELSEWIQNLVDDFNDLSDEEQQNILKTVALVAAIGPAIKIISKLGSGIGKVVEGVGVFSQSIGTTIQNMKYNIETASTLKSSFSSMLGPIGLATTAITGVTGVLIALEKYSNRNIDAIVKTREEIQKEIEERNKLIETQKEQMSSNLSEIDNSKKLYDELKQITDENGKIKDGYQERAEFITNELSKALGIEIDLNGNIIDNYKNLQKEIDKTILKKQAEIYLNAEEERYSEAIQKQNDAYKELINLQEKLADAMERASQPEGDFFRNQDIQKAKLEVQQLGKAIKEQNDLLNDYSEDVAGYEYDKQLMQENTTESLEELINRNKFAYTSETLTIEQETAKQIGFLSNEISRNKELYQENISNHNEANAEIYKNQIESNQNQLIEQAKHLGAMISTTEEITPEVQEAFKNVASVSVTAFNESIKELPPDVQQKLKEIVGVVDTNNETSVAPSFFNLGEDAKNNFNDRVSLMESGVDTTLNNVNDKIKTNTTIQDSTKTLGQNMTTTLNENADGEESGKNFVEGAKDGVNNKGSQKGLFGVITALGKGMIAALNSSLDEHSPSKLTEESGINFVAGPIIGIQEKRKKLLDEINKLGTEAVEEFNKTMNPNTLNINAMQSKLNSSVIDKTQMIFTTPTLNIYTQGEVNVRKIADEVNKIFGSKY